VSIQVIIADDHTIVRQGIRSLLEKIEDIRIVGEAATGQEAVELAEKLKPDVVIMDISMPRLDGAQASQRILAMDSPPAVIILSVHSDTILAQKLIRIGVKGYLLKKSLAEELLLAIRSAAQGELYLSPAIADSVMTSLMEQPADSAPQNPADLLSPREREVLQLIAEGYTNNAIAQALSISVKTAEKHRANLMAKLNVRDLPNLIRTAMKYGLIFSDQE
jgi:DNA-binding NarL/FixJ family response regulator